MFPKCRGGKGVYDVLTLQKSRGGARAHLGRSKAPLPPAPLNASLVYTVNPVIYAAKKIMRFCRFGFKKNLLNNIYANQIPGQSTCVKSFIFVSSYLCALTITHIIHINNITA